MPIFLWPSSDRVVFLSIAIVIRLYLLIHQLFSSWLLLSLLPWSPLDLAVSFFFVRVCIRVHLCGREAEVGKETEKKDTSSLSLLTHSNDSLTLLWHFHLTLLTPALSRSRSVYLNLVLARIRSLFLSLIFSLTVSLLFPRCYHARSLSRFLSAVCKR